jgi:hypothetical protein
MSRSPEFEIGELPEMKKPPKSDGLGLVDIAAEVRARDDALITLSILEPPDIISIGALQGSLSILEPPDTISIVDATVELKELKAKIREAAEKRSEWGKKGAKTRQANQEIWEKYAIERINVLAVNRKLSHEAIADKVLEGWDASAAGDVRVGRGSIMRLLTRLTKEKHPAFPPRQRKRK